MGSERQHLGDFEIVREIGRGGMGVVYEAIQLSLNRKVALKVLPPGTTPEQRDIERFRREAQATASLDHPNIVPIYAQGEEEGTHYYAMRLVRGRSLDKIIHDVRGVDLGACTRTDLERSIIADSQVTLILDQGVLPRPEEGAREQAPPERRRATDLSLTYFRTAARLIMEVAEALEYAHSQGVIHRDIKPHNLMLTSEGRLMVTDFGLARFLSAPSVTISGEMMGTPAYMSPEQVRSEQQAIDHRTDIYSLGITLYEMLALEVPFRADTREALLRQILMKDPPALRRMNPRIPRDLDTICTKAIEKDPNRRYQSAKLFAHDLHCFLEGLPITARPIGPVGRLYRRALRRKALTAAVAGALLALIVGTYFGVQAYRASQREAEERLRAEGEAAAKIEEQRWNLLAEARSLLEQKSYELCLGKLTQAASVRHDHATQLLLWSLARRYSNTPLASFHAQDGEVVSWAFSPDAKTLAAQGKEAAQGKDDTVKLWDVTTGQELRSLSGGPAGEEAPILGSEALAFSPDGKTLASGCGEGTIRVWDVASGKGLRTLAAQDEYVTSVAFSPDGRTLASGGLKHKTIKLWDVASGKELRTLTGHTGGVNSVAFSPDGLTLAARTEERTVGQVVNRLYGHAVAIELLEVATGRELQSLSVEADTRSPFAFSPDGKMLASGSYDKTVKLWDVETGRELRTLSGHTDEVSCVGFGPDGKMLATGSYDKTVKLWEIATGKEVRTLAGHTQGVSFVSFMPDGKNLVSQDTSGTVTVWDVGESDVRKLAGHNEGLLALAFSPDGKMLASGSTDKTVKLWDAASGKELRTLSGKGDGWFSVAFSPDGTTVASAASAAEGPGFLNFVVSLWDVRSGREVRSFAQGCAVAFSPDGKTLAYSLFSGDAVVVKLSDVATGREVGTVGGGEVAPLCLAFSPDGKTLALGSPNVAIDVWDVAAAKKVHTLKRLVLKQHSTLSDLQEGTIAFSPDGRTLAVGGNAVELWDVAAAKKLHTLTIVARWNCPTFSPDGRTLAVGSVAELPDFSISEEHPNLNFDVRVALFDVTTGREIVALGLGPCTPAVAFSPDGRELACCAGNEVLTFDLHAHDAQIAEWLKKAGVAVPASAEGQAHPSSP